MRNLVYYFKEGAFLFSEKWLQYVKELQENACIADKTLFVFAIPNHNSKVNTNLVAKVENVINGASDIDNYIAQNEKLTTSLRYFEAANKSDSIIIETFKKEIEDLKEAKKEAKKFENKAIKLEKDNATLQEEVTNFRATNAFLKQEMAKDVTASTMYVDLNKKLNKRSIELAAVKKENGILKANNQLLTNKLNGK
jgi:predicted RNase H-like nuclease (RuvC/YqgF family)